MSNPYWNELADSARALIAQKLREDAHWRVFAENFARWILAEIESVSRPAEASPKIENPSSEAAPTTKKSTLAPTVIAPSPTGRIESSSRGIVPLKLGDTVIHVPVSGTTAEIGQARLAAAPPETEPAPVAERTLDLDLIAKRCELKADGCRVFIRRRAATLDPVAERTEVEKIQDLVARAKQLPDCFLWMVFPSREQPGDAALALIAETYTNLAHAARLAKVARAGRRDAEQERAALSLLAEATSALRVALKASWLERDDHDQLESFLWLRHTTEAEHIYIERHMRVNDPADPTAWESLRTRIAAMLETLDKRSRSETALKADFKKLAFHAKAVQTKRPEPAPHDWKKIDDAATKLESHGASLDDPRWREHLAPIAAELPPDFTPSAALAAALAHLTRSDEPEESADDSRAWSPAVLAVRAALQGARVVLVGGERDPNQERRLIDAFGLAELDWIGLREHASAAPIRAAIARPGTRLVLALVKLASHEHVDVSMEAAREHGVPCVLLKAGFNPERVAADIRAQVSRQLDLDTAAA